MINPHYGGGLSKLLLLPGYPWVLCLSACGQGRPKIRCCSSVQTIDARSCGWIYYQVPWIVEFVTCSHVSPIDDCTLLEGIFSIIFQTSRTSKCVDFQRAIEGWYYATTGCAIVCFAGMKVLCCGWGVWVQMQLGVLASGDSREIGGA